MRFSAVLSIPVNVSNKKRKRQRTHAVPSGDPLQAETKTVEAKYEVVSTGESPPPDILNAIGELVSNMDSHSSCLTRKEGDLTLSTVEMDRKCSSGFVHYEWRLQKMEHIQLLIDAGPRIQELQRYRDKNMPSLLPRFETELQNASLFQQIKCKQPNSLIKPLSFKRSLVFLDTVLSRKDENKEEQRDLTASCDVYSFFPHGRNFGSSIHFASFYASVHREISTPITAPQAWDSTVFLTFHGTSKEAGLRILAEGRPSIFTIGSQNGKTFGSGFYVSPQMVVALQYALKHPRRQRALVLCATHKGLYHKEMRGWRSAYRASDVVDETEKKWGYNYTVERRDEVSNTSQSYWAHEGSIGVIRDFSLVFFLGLIVF